METCCECGSSKVAYHNYLDQPFCWPCANPAPKPRLRVYFEKRDAWIGVYVARDAVYVCPLPFLVIRWWRQP